MFALRWEDVDLVRGWIVRPAEAQKDGREIRIPVHPILLRELKIERAACRGQQVFAVSEFTRAFRSAVARAGIGHTRWHDMRHSFSDMLRRRTNAAAKDALMGHSPRGVQAIYEHPTSDELREAIESLPDLTLPPATDAENSGRAGEVG